jgi:DNA-binding beta-propeller fold protein YncE
MAFKEKLSKIVLVLTLVVIIILAILVFQKKFINNFQKVPFSIKLVRIIGKKYALKGPADVFFQGSRIIYIVDSGNSRILKFNIQGKYIRQWGLQGGAAGEFMVPLYGTVYQPANEKPDIYIVDSGNSRIQVFTPEGNFIKEFGKSKNVKKMLVEPTYIGFANGKIYVANSGDNDILIYFKDGQFYEKKDPKNKAKHNILKKPVSMAFSKKYIYVSDYKLSKILVFDKEFNLLGTIGTKGENGHKLFHPVGIVYKNGYLFVANYGRSIITVFKLSKGFNVIKSYNFGTPGTGGRNFNHESNISISKNGKYLAAADTNNNRIILYRVFGLNK